MWDNGDKHKPAAAVCVAQAVTVADTPGCLQNGGDAYRSSKGKYISISLWETEADMEAGESSGYLQEQVAKAGPALAGSPVREAFEVSVYA